MVAGVVTDDHDAIVVTVGAGSPVGQGRLRAEDCGAVVRGVRSEEGLDEEEETELGVLGSRGSRRSIPRV